MGKYSEGKDYKVIAFIVAFFHNDERMDMIRAVARECGKHNCKVVFYSTLSDFYNHDLTDMGEKKIFDAVSVERYDAVVLMAESFKQDEDYLRMVKKAQEAGVPVISVDKELTGCINIHFDYKSVFREIVEHMIEYHGYRKVNFIAGFRNNTFSDDRLAVYREVLERNSIPYDPERVYYGEFWSDPTLQAMDEMEKKGFDDIDAIICANDIMAIVAGNYLMEHGYRIPEDIAVSGFDGIRMEKYCVPRLTTGIYNLEGFINTFFHIIDEELQKEDCPKDWTIYNKMQLGRSCGCDGVLPKHAAFEMVQLKQAIDSEIKFQGTMGQMVTNFANTESATRVFQEMPQYIKDMRYKDFWYCMNVLAFKAEDTNYAAKMKVMHYHCSETEGTGGEKSIDMDFGELIPDLDTYLQTTDYLLVMTMHMEGKTTGYTVLNFDIEKFWATAYATFLVSFRHLQEMRNTYRMMLDTYQKDPLTGLYNRTGFYHVVQTLMVNSSDLEMSVIMMDMDHLKMINDNFGHMEGDYALQTLGNIVKNSVGQELAARIGGDEFLIVMTGESTSERAEAIANTVREGIRQHNLQHPDKGYELQASIGTYTNHIGNHMLDYFMKKADDIMYAIKYCHHREVPVTQEP